jgi:hypothetical protein
LNGDGAVDASDVGRLKFTFNCGLGDPLKFPYLDGDHAGAVDSEDVGQSRAWLNINAF